MLEPGERPSAPHAAGRILVVDDDVRLLASYVRGLARSGGVVFAAATPTEAVAISRRERLTAAIVDLRIGGASGIDLIKELKSGRPNLTTILVSGYLSARAAFAAARAGADDVVLKPVSCAELLRRIQQPLPPFRHEETPTLAHAQWQYTMKVLADCDGNISEAARRLGVHRTSLQRRLRSPAPRK